MTSFRGLPACSCLVAWLPAYEAELQRRGVLNGPLRVYQLIGGAEASGGTHAQGGAFDITDLVGPGDVAVARKMGADATWARTEAQGFMPHLHGVLTGCPHNSPARYQIDAVRAGFNGLGKGGRGGPDDGPRPLSGRTWQQGIAWADRQRAKDDDLMAFSEWTDTEKAAFRDFIQQAVRTTKIQTIADDGSRVDENLASLLRNVKADIDAIRKG